VKVRRVEGYPEADRLTTDAKDGSDILILEWSHSKDRAGVPRGCCHVLVLSQELARRIETEFDWKPVTPLNGTACFLVQNTVAVQVLRELRALREAGEVLEAWEFRTAPTL